MTNVRFHDRQVEQRPPGILYHYTSMDGFVRILQTGRIRATNIGYLNDSHEFRLIGDRLFRAMKGLDGLSSAERNAILSAADRYESQWRSSSHYVASFSEEGNSLSQWRAYAPYGDGLSIGFDGARLCDVEGAGLVRVRYENDSTTECTCEGHASVLARLSATEIERLAHEIVERSRPGDAGFGRRLEETFEEVQYPLSYLFKHSAFASEREWRLVAELTMKEASNNANLLYRPGAGMIKPFVELDVGTAADPARWENGVQKWGADQLREIIIGPGPHQKLVEHSVKLLTRSTPMPLPRLQLSEIPFRPA